MTFFIFMTQTFNKEKCSKMFTGFRIIIIRITRLIMRYAHDSKIHSLLLIHLGWVLLKRHQHNTSGLSGKIGKVTLSCERGGVTSPGQDENSWAHYHVFKFCTNYQSRTLQTMTNDNDDNTPQHSKAGIDIPILPA